MNTSDKSDMSDKPNTSDTPSFPLIPKHGGYRNLRSFQVARRVYDATRIFCDRFVEKRSRTHDQMVQAARSGVQNIAEASMASGTSKKTEIKLTNVARASLEELLLDYEDFLRQNGLRRWEKDSPEALRMRHNLQQSDVSNLSDWSDSSNSPPDPHNISNVPPEIAANTLLCLINQASYLLHQQLKTLETNFVHQGGFTERLYTVRTNIRHPQPPPSCPRCGKLMCQRIARQGPHAGQPFWGCSRYPDCNGIQPIRRAA